VTRALADSQAAERADPRFRLFGRRTGVSLNRVLNAALYFVATHAVENAAIDFWFFDLGLF
jgi:hypothetical protein